MEVRSALRFKVADRKDLSMSPTLKWMVCGIKIASLIAVSLLLTGCPANVRSIEIDWQSPIDDSGNCFRKTFGVSKEPVTWLEAQTVCDTHGDGLATNRKEVEFRTFIRAWSKVSINIPNICNIGIKFVPVASHSFKKEQVCGLRHHLKKF